MMRKAKTTTTQMEKTTKAKSSEVGNWLKRVPSMCRATNSYYIRVSGQAQYVYEAIKN